MKNIKPLLATLLSVATIAHATTTTKPQIITIGIIEPIKHQAMDEIVSGFTQVTDQYNKQQSTNKIVIKVENAQADANLERAIIQKMALANYDIIAPIGVDATYMTLSQIKDKPVISIASDINEKDRTKMDPCHVAVVHDEISNQQMLNFSQAAYPNVKKILLVYSNSNKVFPEVANFKQIAKSKNIEVNAVMVNSLAEMDMTLKQSIKDNQMIFILKDHLIVSAIANIAKIANSKKIPLVTSDQGSVVGGGGFALGVPEKNIGIDSAKLALDIIKGTPTCSIPIVDMTDLRVFINKKALIISGQNPQTVIDTATKLKYKIEIVG